MNAGYQKNQGQCRTFVLATLLMAGSMASWATGGASPGSTVRASGASKPARAAYAGLDGSTIAEIRADFTKAVESMAATVKAISSLEARFPGDRLLWPPMARAYRASLDGLVGKHSPNLLEKFNRVKAAIAGYEGLIEAYPGSLELRFMRFAFYSQLPGFFGVGEYVDPDRAILTDLLEQGSDTLVPDSQKREMITWILKDGKPDKRQTARLQTAAARLDGR